ncbi:SAM-dependent methyltransferase [Nocardia callitridis]|uniref:S-adenosyl-L-methionine-dependent methyltransferase n=1 Tax=Nocardia callitridis TaxID=648753 RepID=A0ABP9KLQ0_9NOCA
MRTDSDGWDIVNSVGATALGVAALRAGETRRSDALFRDPYAALLVEAVGVPGWTRLVRGQVDFETGAAPSLGPLGDMLVARTCYFDAYFAMAVNAGIRQVVILGAGLDVRAFRLEWAMDTVLFELDQPKVLEFKASVFDEHGIFASVDRREVAVDLRRGFSNELRDSGFDPTQPTAWLAEGLLRYVPAGAQNRMFIAIAELSAPGSQVALTLEADPAQDGEHNEEMRDRMLAELGISLDMGSLLYPNEGRSDPVDWFRSRGWTGIRTDPSTVLSSRGRKVPPAVADQLRKNILMTATKPGEGVSRR